MAAKYSISFCILAVVAIAHGAATRQDSLRPKRAYPGAFHLPFYPPSYAGVPYSPFYPSAAHHYQDFFHQHDPIVTASASETATVHGTPVPLPVPVPVPAASTHPLSAHIPEYFHNDPILTPAATNTATSSVHVPAAVVPPVATIPAIPPVTAHALPEYSFVKHFDHFHVAESPVAQPSTVSVVHSHPEDHFHVHDPHHHIFDDHYHYGYPEAHFPHHLRR